MKPSDYGTAGRRVGYPPNMSTIVKDFLVPDSPFRGLILQGELCLLAYIGVPEAHWLADMEELRFDCHWCVSWRAPGDGVCRPAGWYWYGWDYGHAGDYVSSPELDAIRELVKAKGLVMPSLNGGKRWTVEEVMLDVIDVAVNLQAALAQAEDCARGVVLPAA